MYYKISETLIPCIKEEAMEAEHGYVAVLTPAEWDNAKKDRNYRIVLPLEVENIKETKLETNFDLLSGGFHIPSFEEHGSFVNFAFVIEEKGIAFIDKDDNVVKYVSKIIETRNWKYPSVARFLFDFLDLVIRDEAELLVEIEKQLDEMEGTLDAAVLSDEFFDEYVKIRNSLRSRTLYYEQLIDCGQGLQANENEFFTEEQLRYFQIFTGRAEHLKATLMFLRDYSIQVREQSKNIHEIRQNKILATLTIVTSICAPASLAAAWYGMNFKYMPELNWKFSYPILFIICLVNALITTRKFKKMGYI